MKINVRNNVDEVIKGMTAAANKQVPYATSKAVNAMVDAGEKEISKQINSGIDNPVPFTRKSTFKSYSNKNRKPITGIVGIKDKQAAYLDYTEHGGTSPARGKAKPVPTTSLKNRAGNIPRGKIARLLSNKTKYFSGSPNGRPPGVYERMGPKGRKALRMLAGWQKETRHSKRTRFGERVAIRVQRDIMKALRREISKAVSNAR